MIADWNNDRETNQGKLLRYLDVQRYSEFAERFLEFGETPWANVARSNGQKSAPTMVTHAAPAIIYIRYEAVRTYEPILSDPHMSGAITGNIPECGQLDNREIE